MSGRRGARPRFGRFGPSERILALAQHKTSKSVWATTPWKEEEEEEEVVFRKTRHPSSKTSQHQNILRLSTPRPRSCVLQETGRPHTSHCEKSCPVWHVEPRTKAAVASPRLLLLSEPKRTHPDHQNSRESAASVVSAASQTASVSERLVQLSLPKLRDTNVCYQLGRLEEPIWTVSQAAKRARESARVRTLAAPKQLHKDYVPPREAEWTRKHVKSN